MKKEIIIRCLIGAPIGLTISTLITIFVSAAIGDGNFYPVMPALVSDFGTEMNAVAVQAVFSLLCGAAWGGASVIWEAENWSLLRQTATHLIICSLATLPIAYIMRWMDRSVSGVASYFIIFFAIYACIWIAQYIYIKKKLDAINGGIEGGGSD